MAPFETSLVVLYSVNQLFARKFPDWSLDGKSQLWLEGMLMVTR